MENRPLLTRVVLENYKSLAFCDVKLGPLSILVGPNGAGKSNFVDALRFLTNAINGPIENAFEKRGGFSSVLRRGKDDSPHVSFRIEFAFSNGKGSYSVRLTRRGAADYFVEREGCVVELENVLDFYEAKHGVLSRSSQKTAPKLTPGYLYLPLMSAHPAFSPVFVQINSWRRYNFSPDAFRHPVPSGGPEMILTSDGANLSNVLNHIKLHHPIVFERIIQYLTVINPSLKLVETVEFGGYRSLEFLQHSIDGTFSPRQMSDGTLRSLAALVALYQRSAGSVLTSLVMLEEPETALHPAAAGVLFDALREASASVQVIATTHSADLLDKGELDEDAILAVELERGMTRLGHVDATGRHALRKRLYTVGELMRMDYLKPESSRVPSEDEKDSILFGDLVKA